MNRFLRDVLKVAEVSAEIVVPLIVAPKTSPSNLPTKTFDLLESALNISSMSQVTPMWLQYAARVFSTLPYIIAGIQHIHGDTIAGTEKKALAMEALGLSFQLASTVDPQHAPAINAATVMAGNAIDDLVALMKAAKEAPVAPVPAAQ